VRKLSNWDTQLGSWGFLVTISIYEFPIKYMIIYAHDDTIIFWFMKPRMFDGHDSSLLKLLKLYTKTVWWFGTFG
jgi:hypothetical protein